MSGQVKPLPTVLRNNSRQLENGEVWSQIRDAVSTLFLSSHTCSCLLHSRIQSINEQRIGAVFVLFCRISVASQFVCISLLKRNYWLSSFSCYSFEWQWCCHSLLLSLLWMSWSVNACESCDPGSFWAFHHGAVRWLHCVLSNSASSGAFQKQAATRHQLSSSNTMKQRFSYYQLIP